MTELTPKTKGKKIFYIVCGILLILVSIGFLIYTLTKEKKKTVKHKIEHADLNSEIHALSNDIKLFTISNTSLVKILNNYANEKEEYINETGLQRMQHIEYIPIFYKKYKVSINDSVDSIMNQFKTFFNSNNCSNTSELINHALRIVSALNKYMDNKYRSDINFLIKEIQTIKYKDSDGLQRLFAIDLLRANLAWMNLTAYILTRGQKIYVDESYEKLSSFQMPEQIKAQLDNLILVYYKQFNLLITNLRSKISKELDEVLDNLHKDICETEKKIDEMIDKKTDICKDPILIGTILNHGIVFLKLFISLLSNDPDDKAKEIKQFIDVCQKINIPQIAFSVICDADVLLSVISRLCEDEDYLADYSKTITELIESNFGQDGTFYKIINLIENTSEEDKRIIRR